MNTPTGAAELPAVIGALDFVVDYPPVAEPHKPMRAAVFQRVQFAVLISEEHDRLAPNLPPYRLFAYVGGFGDHVPTIGIDAGAADVAELQFCGGCRL